MRDGRYNTTPAVDGKAAKLRADGLSWQAIGEVLGVSDKTAKAAAERGANSVQLETERAAATELSRLLANRWRRLTDPELVALSGRRDGRTLEAIGVELGVSRQRVQQLQVQAERKLREER